MKLTSLKVLLFVVVMGLGAAWLLTRDITPSTAWPQSSVVKEGKVVEMIDPPNLAPMELTIGSGVNTITTAWLTIRNVDTRDPEQVIVTSDHEPTVTKNAEGRWEISFGKKPVTSLAPDGVNTITDHGRGIKSTTLVNVVSTEPHINWDRQEIITTIQALEEGKKALHMLGFLIRENSKLAMDQFTKERATEVVIESLRRKLYKMENTK